MPRYIDTEKLKQFAVPVKDHTGKIEKVVLYKDIDKVPTADVQEVRHGTYINTNHGGIHGDCIYRCSCCGNEREAYIEEENYCPNCGAKMDGKE